MRSDTERAQRPLISVEVTAEGEGIDGEFYSVGHNNVTSINWGWTHGSNAAIQTVRVYQNDKLYSEHPFPNVKGVYYRTEEG